jgi:HK97 family phage prohead protease
MSLTLAMEVRSVDEEARTVIGRCVPYDTTSYLTPKGPSGERVIRGAFAKSISERAGKIFLYRAHDHAHAIGRSTGWQEEPDGLLGSFHIRPAPLGDDVLAELRDGYLPGMSCGFRPIKTRRGKDGATEVVEAALMEVSLVSIPAYEGAEVLALRHKADVAAIMATFGSRPDIDLSPIPLPF